jgi:hypothetical protein
LFAQIRVLTIFFVADALILVLSLLGFYILIKWVRKNNVALAKNFYLPLFCFLFAIVGMIVIQVPFNFGGVSYGRFIFYAAFFSPFFVGLFLWAFYSRLKRAFRKPWLGSVVFIALLVCCVLISMIQAFPLQPLAPSAHELSSDLPESEPLFDYQQVNSIYQISMFNFASTYSQSASIVLTDATTKWQAWAFSSPTFYNKILWYSVLEISGGTVPLSSLSVDDQNSLKGLKIILHYDGKAGPLNEAARQRTPQVIDQAKTDWGSVIYDNGQSFIMADQNPKGFSGVNKEKIE